MRKYTILSVLFAAFVLTSCADYLNIKPKDKISQENLFSSAAGVELYMANLYSQLPVEDFNYMRDGFDQHYTHSNMVPAMFTEEATHSQYVDHYSVNYFRWWNSAFRMEWIEHRHGSWKILLNAPPASVLWKTRPASH